MVAVMLYKAWLPVSLLPFHKSILTHLHMWSAQTLRDFLSQYLRLNVVACLSNSVFHVKIFLMPASIMIWVCFFVVGSFCFVFVALNIQGNWDMQWLRGLGKVIHACVTSQKNWGYFLTEWVIHTLYTNGEQQLFLQVSHKFHSNLQRSYDTSAPLVVTSVYGLISVPCLTVKILLNQHALA